MKEQIKDYFDFNKKEKNGIFILLIVIVLLLLANLLIPYLYRDKRFVDFSQYEKEIKEFERKRIVNDVSDSGKNYRNNHYRFESGIKYTKEYPAKVQTNDNNLKIELNTTDSIQLLVLKGIGPVYAKRIIKYRDLLGGFINKKQLCEVYGISEELYNSISNYVFVDSTYVRKININKASFKDLMRHPYIGFDIAKSIVNLRKQQGLFSKPDEIKYSNLINDEVYSKIVPYICL